MDGGLVVVKLDQMWHYVQKTNKLWVWRAYDPFKRRTVVWVTGGRDDATYKRLLDRINTTGQILIADHREGFQRLIPSRELCIMLRPYEKRVTMFPARRQSGVYDL